MPATRRTKRTTAATVATVATVVPPRPRGTTNARPAAVTATSRKKTTGVRAGRKTVEKKKQKKEDLVTRSKQAMKKRVQTLHELVSNAMEEIREARRGFLETVESIIGPGSPLSQEVEAEEATDMSSIIAKTQEVIAAYRDMEACGRLVSAASPVPAVSWARDVQAINDTVRATEHLAERMLAESVAPRAGGWAADVAGAGSVGSVGSVGEVDFSEAERLAAAIVAGAGGGGGRATLAAAIEKHVEIIAAMGSAAKLGKENA